MKRLQGYTHDYIQQFAKFVVLYKIAIMISKGVIEYRDHTMCVYIYIGLAGRKGGKKSEKNSLIAYEEQYIPHMWERTL